GYLPPVLAKAASVLPLLPLELAARRLLANAMAARPSFARRLGEYSGRTFAVDPADLPFAFLIAPNEGRAAMRVVRNLSGAEYDARISAPMLVLLGMIDGTYDGDALFFSRDLVIEGDTEAVLALRNAIENAELDPSSVLGLPKRICGPFNRATEVMFDDLRRMLDAPLPSGPSRKAYPA
ncbi:MAG: SCP2 sterol-binding domain-containing protein, partial [Alphaproteobacteria bacterium]|nr:SCP2 sterol-binding domain-containing protein [Alphaproteobacteria bacterium]